MTTTTPSIVSFDTSTLLNYYNAKASAAAARAAATTSSTSSSSSSSSSKKGATANDVTPWSTKSESQEHRDAEVLSATSMLDPLLKTDTKTSFIDLSKVPVSAGTSSDTKTEQDNQRLFALYQAVNNLSYLASMAKRDDVTDGQREGYNTRFQNGLAEIQKFISSTDFNNFTLQAKEPAASVTSSAKVASATFSYITNTLADGNSINNPLSGLSTSDKFTVSVTKNGTPQDIEIDLSKVSGDLTMSNVVSYVNDQLKAAGVTTRFKKTMTAGDITATKTADKAKQTYSLEVVPGTNEKVSLSAASTPSLYISATTGLTTATEDSAVDNQGRLIKISDLSSTDPTADYARTMSPTNGTTTASSTLVDGSGNIYMLGTATGDLGSKLNQGDQDVYLTKYDSAGNVLWQRMLGSSGTATGTAMALNPNGGVTIVGSSTAPVTSTQLPNTKADSYAAQYDQYGNQVWSTQIPTLNENSATSVSVGSDGTVYIGGTTTKVIGSGQVNQGGNDAYLATISNKGKILSESQFGTSGNDTVSATTVTDTGDLVVASVQDGHAILTKYTGGDTSQAAAWTYDMGALGNGGAVSGLAVKDGKIYVSGTTSSSSLNATTAGGTSTSGGADAFLFTAVDQGTSVDTAKLTYLGTSSTDKGAALTVGDDGTVYVAGTTGGTFSGNSTIQKDTTNMFVAAVAADGSVNWVRQYGGKDGQSVGTGVAFASSGASVLDALGLPSGQVQGTQDNALTNNTTLRAGDFFKVQIEGDAGRTFKITIDKGETLTSLCTKLNAQLGSKGKASVSYGSGGASLKIEASAGATLKLMSGTTDVIVPGDASKGVATTTVAGSNQFDALARLGIAEQTLSKAATNKSTSDTSTSTSSSTTANTYAVGMPSNLDISTSTGAGSARAQLMNVLSAVQKIYQTTNTPASSSTTTAAKTSNQTVSAAMTSYNNNLNANASLALSILSA
jgi:hypothetical protein